MDASSLIFVAIIAIWAVYLVQHWVRRREQLITSRAVDRFSADLRILERRVPIPVALPKLPSVATGPIVPTLTARTKTSSVTASTVIASSVTAATAEVVMPVSPRPLAQPRSLPRRTHRVRASIFLGLLVATPVAWAAHVFGTLLLWPAALVTVFLVLDLALVRRVARVQRRAAARRGMAGSSPVSRSRPATTTTTTTAERVRAEITVAPASEPLPTPVHSQEALTEVIVLEGSWEPVRVPPPIYTMKAKAERPAASSAAPAPMESDSSPVREPLPPELIDLTAVAADDELDAVLDRRRAAGE